MITIHDLFDLHYVFLFIRADAKHEDNAEVLRAVLNVLQGEWSDRNWDNRIRDAIVGVQSLHREKWKTMFHYNQYCYNKIIRDKQIINILIRICETMISALKNQDFERVADLADAAHNLPHLIVENNYTIPSYYWKHDVQYFRKKWDRNFLIDEQRSIRNKKLKLFAIRQIRRIKIQYRG